MIALACVCGHKCGKSARLKSARELRRPSCKTLVSHERKDCRS